MSSVKITQPDGSVKYVDENSTEAKQKFDLPAFRKKLEKRQATLDDIQAYLLHNLPT